MAVKQKYGGLKIVWHPEKLTALRKGNVIAPIYVRIKPTNKCDQRCFYCSYDPDIEIPNVLSEGFNRADEIPKSKLIEILNDFKEIGVKSITWSGGGEPLVHPDIAEIFKKVNEYGIDNSIITNGQKLNGERAEYLAQAKWVRISLDACDAKTFSKSKRVPERLFGELEKNIKDFAKRKNSNCELGINFVIHHLNADKVYDSAKFFKDIGANHMKTTPRWIDDGKKWVEYHRQSKQSVLEQIEKAQEEIADDSFDIFDTYRADFENYEKDIELKGAPTRGYNKCYIMQTIPVIGADSVVYFCHDKTYSEVGTLGSIKNQSFKDLWFSKEAKEKFENFNPEGICKHCVYDSRNVFIQSALDCYGEHVNFP